MLSSPPGVRIEQAMHTPVQNMRTILEHLNYPKSVDGITSSTGLRRNPREAVIFPSI